jgi:SnoaL-like domain
VSARLEIIRRMNAAFNARDPDWTASYAQDVEFVMPPDWVDDRVFHGREGVERAAGMWREQLDGYGWDEERLIDTGEFVVGLFRHRGRIPGGDARVESEVGAVFFFEGREVARVVTYGTWAETLQAAGMDS